MASQFIPVRSGTGLMVSRPNAASIQVDSADSYKAKYNANGTIKKLLNEDEMFVEVALTNAQIKALRATPVAVIPAQGAGKVIVVTSCTVFLKYGGTNAFTAQNSDNNLVLRRKDTSGCVLFQGLTQAFMQATASGVAQLQTITGGSPATVFDSKTQSDNQAIVAHNGSAGEISGNAAGDNTLLLKIGYRVYDVTGW